MKLAIMQPYFFPYIGYWQLIHAADVFVLFDDIQYIRHGWINRNRILKPGGGAQYFMATLQKHSTYELIRNISAHPDTDWKRKILGQLDHYKKRAPYFTETRNIVAGLLDDIQDLRIARINLLLITGICALLGLERTVVLSSECNFDYSNACDAGEWALRISEQLGALSYINPISGASLFSPEKFHSSGVALTFLEPGNIVYDQRESFVPWLSIIDVLMFNGVAGTKNMLPDYRIESSASQTT